MLDRILGKQKTGSVENRKGSIMEGSAIAGIILVTIAGLCAGSNAWQMKLMHKFKFEHWWLIGMFVGLVVLPWTVTLIGCPNAFQAYSEVPLKTIMLSNLFALSWGIANVLCGICYVRIGMGLTGAVLTGLGVSVGVTMPMILKGSGMFNKAPDLGSPAGKTVMLGVCVMLIGVMLAAYAGLMRDRSLKKQNKTSGNFVVGLIMAAIAGITSCGMSLAFVYGQGPIVDAMVRHGAGNIPASFAVWAVGLIGGTLVNIIYPSYLVTKNKSWNVFTQSGKEMALSIIIGIQFCAGMTLMGKGMLLLGPLGASVGFGIQQASQMMGSQGVGFISGEWRGAGAASRRLMYFTILVLITAAAIMAYGNKMAGG